jgi:hypothetical protein
MAQHSNYWSCTPFADWVRGTPKGGAKTSEGWDEWNDEAKRYNPVRYWLAEEALDKLQDFVTYPIRKIYDLKYYINNRYVTRTHALTAHSRDIKPGSWCDVGNRFLPCLFNELVDFVEIEQAWSHIAWGSKEDRKKYDAPFYATGWWRWRTWRCPQAGIDHLDWAMTLTLGNDMGVDEANPEHGKPTGQALRAKEIKELYMWWTTVYPNRPDPHDASGWSDYCESLRIVHGTNWIGRSDRDTASKKAGDKALKLTTKIEAAYDKEDTEMMIRLIKIRDSLWT